MYRFSNWRASSPEARLCSRLPGAVPVIRVNEVDEGLGQQLLAGIPESPLEGGVHPLEVAVGARDAQQVERQVEDACQLVFRSRRRPCTLAKAAVVSFRPGQQLGPRPLEGADVGPMVQPVVADRGVRRPDLAGQPLRRDAQVAEGPATSPISSRPV